MRLVDTLKKNFLIRQMQMGYLIILRGPAGAGKTTISKCLIETLGWDKTFSLDLDITLDKENEFNVNLNKALGYENVVGMMFWGLKHTEAPQQ
jgi:predicted AAA+ superfamily ATPase